MKTLKFLSFLILFVFVACEKNQGSGQTEQPDVTPVVYERTVWVNEDVECCGVKDPLNNLGWLNEWYMNSFFYKEYNAPSYGFIYVFRNDSTLENFIVTRIYGTLTRHYFELFTCDGNVIDKGRYVNYNNDYTNPEIKYSRENMPIPPCLKCEEFFQNHTLIDTIYHFYTK